MNCVVPRGRNADTAGKGRLRTIGEGAGGERSFWPLIGGTPLVTPAANRPLLPRNPRGGGTGGGRGTDTGTTAGPEQELVVVGTDVKCRGLLTSAVTFRVGVVTTVTARGLG